MSEEKVSNRRWSTLQKLMVFDLKRKQEILGFELDHLKDSINYRLPNQNGGPATVTPEAPNNRGRENFGSAYSLLIRIQDSAEELLKQIKSDIKEREKFEKFWEKSTNQSEYGHSPASVHAYENFHQVWQAKMLVKTSVIAERLGELHDRLGQQLERTNPDHPNPVLRRRAEQGQVDKFLCEHVKWVHRDLVKFTEHLEVAYPYKQVPSTFYSWQYEASSSQHSFVSYDNYCEEWKKWATAKGSESQEKPKKFTSIGLSYWMPERLVSHPIIGHELAHQVIQDIYGRDNPYVRLEHQKDALSRTIRRLIRCAESWCLHRDGEYNNPAQVWALVREIMCDVLAAERYGCAYLLAWLLEIGEIDVLADFMHDPFGMFRPTEFGSEDDNVPGEVDPQFIQREILTPSRSVAHTIRPDIYYRGKVLVGFLRAHKRETDKLSQELLREADNWLERFLDLASGVHSNPEQVSEFEHLREFEVRFARDLSLTVVEEYSRVSNFNLEGIVSPDSSFMKHAKKHWKLKEKKPTDFTLARQVMSDPVRKTYVNMINEFRSDVLQTASEQGQLRTFQDALWRVEWAMGSTSKEQSRDSLNTFRNRLRALNFIATDDYLYRTGNPHRLLQAIAHKRLDAGAVGLDTKKTSARANSHIKYMTGQGNTLSSDTLKDMYDPSWMNALDSAIRQQQPVTLDFGFGVSFTISKSEILKLTPIRLGQEEFDEIGICDRALNVLHLISLKPAVPSNWQELLKARYGDSDNVSLLLGRYDALMTGVMPEQERYESTKFHGVSRLKRLVEVGTTKRGGEGKHLAVLMISLFLDASRMMFGIWLKRYTKEQKIGVFLSDGWEDLVVVIPLQDDIDLRIQVSTLLKFVDDLNMSPLIAGTETLVSREVLSESTSFCYRFVCARGSDGLRSTKMKIEKAITEMGVENRSYVIENVSGAKDFQVTLIDQKVAVRVHKALHGAAESGGFRVETRVSWPLELSSLKKGPRFLRKSDVKQRRGRIFRA